jgi:hypothetical protein
MVSETEDTIKYDKYNEEVVVRRKRKMIKSPFSAVGELTSSGDKQKDIFDLLDQVSKGAFSLFTALKRCRNVNNNLVKYSTKDWSKTQKETFSRRLRELRKYKIVRIARARMDGLGPNQQYVCKRQTYMINPDLLKCWEYDDADLLWSQCKP